MQKKVQSARKVPAWICLAALMVLQAPIVLGLSTFSIASCCTGKMCAASEHVSRKSSLKIAGGKNEPIPMNCAHSAGNRMECSMACCQQKEQISILAAIFVMPDIQNFPTAVREFGNAIASSAIALPGFQMLHSPPPRYER